MRVQEEECYFHIFKISFFLSDSVSDSCFEACRGFGKVSIYFEGYCESTHIIWVIDERHSLFWLDEIRNKFRNMFYWDYTSPILIDFTLFIENKSYKMYIRKKKTWFKLYYMGTLLHLGFRFSGTVWGLGKQWNDIAIPWA